MKNSKSLSVNVAKDSTLISTKQFAKTIGVSTETIRTNGKILFPNKSVEKGKPVMWTESECNLILEKIRTNQQGSKATSKAALEAITTDITPAVKVQQFISSIDYNDESAVDMVTATITALSSNLIAALHGENKSLVKENKMLKHQVEYNEVIGCSRWADVKKLLGIKESWESICNLLNLEENVDYFKKCMGYDKYPTVLLPDNTIARIKKEICKK